MAFNFRSADRDQQFLMPPSLSDWLPDEHLAFFVLDAVGELDLADFYARYRPDGRGGAAYEPAMMVALLIYAYCVGDRSSRRIERRLVEDVAYRVIAANETPDHATIARFRAGHEAALAGLFNQVLALCAAAGLVRVGLVAIDGTKIAADASRDQTMSEDRLAKAIAAEVARIMAEAAAIDAAEDELYGEARGDELPPELADRSRRIARLREAKAALDAAAAERDESAEAEATKRAADAAAGRKRRGRPPTKPAPDQKPLFINATDPDSRLMPSRKGFLQGYNAQAVATAEQIIVAAEVITQTNDLGAFVPTMAAARANLDDAGVGEDIGVALADAGYYSADNAEAGVADEVLIATTKAAKLDRLEPETVEEDPLAQARAWAETLAAGFDAVAARDTTIAELALSLDLSEDWLQALRRRYRRGGVEVLVPRRRAKGTGAAPSRKHRVRVRMQARLASDDGKALYRQRAQTIEPVFGQIKEARGVRRFARRGLAACNAEWKLIAATHNLLKLYRFNTAAG